jgi:predicted phage terminase large subunit-like protein
LKELASRKTLDGLVAYGEYVFGYHCAEHHREMLDSLLAAIAKAGTEEAENVVILEPRGHAKTTWGNTILLSWLIAQFPHLRIGLLSNTGRQAYDFSRAIRWTYENNPRHREIFGDCVSLSKWTDAEWLTKESPWHGSKDVTMFAAGAGGAIVSKRFDVIFADDILDEENTQSPEQREAVNTWWQKTVRPCLTPEGVIILLGTRWASEDLYETLTTEGPEGEQAEFRLTIRRAINHDEHGEEHALWPEVWPLKRLQKERKAMGTALFSCAYQNDVTGLMEGNVFLKRNFQYYKKLEPEKHYTVRMGVDLASSTRETADFTARLTTAEDEDGNFYVISAYRDRRETGHAAFVNDGFLAAPNVSLVIVENNQFQSTLVQEILSDYPRIPIEGKKSDVDKKTRARAVAAKYEGHKVYHHESLRGGEFEEELLSFDRGHDDMVDALGFSMDLGGDQFYFTSVRR